MASENALFDGKCEITTYRDDTEIVFVEKGVACDGEKHGYYARGQKEICLSPVHLRGEGDCRLPMIGDRSKLGQWYYHLNDGSGLLDVDPFIDRETAITHAKKTILQYRNDMGGKPAAPPGMWRSHRRRPMMLVCDNKSLKEQIKGLTPCQQEELAGILERKRNEAEALARWFTSRIIEPDYADDLMLQLMVNIIVENTNDEAEADDYIRQKAEWMKEATKLVRADKGM